MKLQRIFAILLVVSTIAANQVFSQQHKVIDVSVTGLDGVPLANVLSQLSLSLQQNNERLTESMVQRCYDLADEEIKQALEPFGFYTPFIEKSIDRDGEFWRVRLNVLLGEPVRIVEVDIQLAGVGSDEPALVEAVSRFPLHQGDILDHQLYEQGKKELSSTAISAGYRDAGFSRNSVEIDRQKHNVRIFLSLDTGPQYLFGRTTFVADFLNKGLLHRMLPYDEGEPFSTRKIIQLRQALLNSDYFDQVEVKTGDTDPGSLDVPMSIRLTPNNPNKYGVGFGYGTDTGFRGSLEWTNRLLNRYGHQLNLQLQPSERKDNFGLVYTIPIYDPRRDRLALHGTWEQENYDNTRTVARNASISYDHIREMGEYSIYLGGLDEDYEIGEKNGHATLLMPGIKSTWRLADDRLKTKNGVRATVNLTGSGEDLASDATFLQASLNSKAILTFYEQWRIIGRFQFGGTLVDDIADLPPSLRFYAGGDQSVRGYAYKSIGPADSAGNIFGAKNLLSYSLELERKLFGNWSAALFFDSGDAMNSLTELHMRNGTGIGLRWTAPFGQVRLDVAEAISEGKSSWRIHFNVGADL